MVIVQKLVPLLPPGFAAEPRVRLGKSYEVDIGAYEDGAPFNSQFTDGGGGTATLTQPAVVPTWTAEADPADADEPDEYAIYVYDEREYRKLVAAIEIVSPGNKDRPETRAAFAAKAVTLLQKGVCVSIIDLVTTRNFNLYTQTLYTCRQKDPTLSKSPPSIYASTVRFLPAGRRKRIEAWFYELKLGQNLPEIPIWLDDDIRVMVDLSASYEETCEVLKIA